MPINKALEKIVKDKNVIRPFNDILLTDITDMSKKEHDAYIDLVKDKTTREVLEVAVLDAGDGNVSIDYVLAEPCKFERIRRITGYLVGTTDRWNNAKKAELRDRTMNA